EEEYQFIEELKKRSDGSYQLVDIYSMMVFEKNNSSRLVEVRGIEAGFPFYGEVKGKGQLLPDGLYISEDLQRLWDVQIGDAVQLGELKFHIKDIIKVDSLVGLRGFSLAPRVYLPLVDLKKSGLLKFGATGGYSQHFLFKNYTTKDLES